uniref:Uncharacterized protein n=1 Tax=uncultured Thiotrichaceae bacterium TaxID=298394 RepID=A0A6S6SDZ2_9GAMM|nr:MAG: Unknown protein [uncultured Thiotrichaceae bacterium]
MIPLIAAMTPDRVIGRDGDMRWCLSVDSAQNHLHFLPQTDRLYITLTHASVDGDNWFLIASVNKVC